MWFRRDLRIGDNPALSEALDNAADGTVLGLFVLDPALIRSSGAPRLAALYGALRSLDEQLDGRLVITTGTPEMVLPRVCRDVGAESVHCAADFGPYGLARDSSVAQALATLHVPLVRSGSAYAVMPGRILNGSGKPYQVYSAYYRTWREHGWAEPHPETRPTWLDVEGDPVPADPRLPSTLTLPDIGEAAAIRAWKAFLDKGIDNYSDLRNRPDLEATSRMSAHLKWGTIHPRTMLGDLTPRHETYRKELAWREFYADVLYHRPASARNYYRPELKAMPWATGNTATTRFQAWAAGQTGFPIVDAGMRQLLAEGWMHNRVRMIVASFLVKDLHVEWMLGARHFMRHLIDADLASNSHGWQWVAGTGTDAAPYFRIFNPTLQGKKFDPDGNYVRRWVPELSHLSAKIIHEPWLDPNGAPASYPAPLVDHATERDATLADYAALR
jgi:deoxyribodipyrimidine photo-lyase